MSCIAGKKNSIDREIVTSSCGKGERSGSKNVDAVRGKLDAPIRGSSHS
jgi:hypothetical protein